MTPLEVEKREHDRQLVLDYQRMANECARAHLNYPDNFYLKNAMDFAIKNAARSLVKFVRKYGDLPAMNLQLENDQEGF
jgi:hypothetical protein